MTQSGLSSVVLGHMSEDSRYHHATTVQAALQQGSSEAAALQCNATAYPPLQDTADCGCTWEFWGKEEAKIVQERGHLCKSSHGMCGLVELQVSGSTQMAASTS